jgi:hypothetical protein
VVGGDAEAGARNAVVAAVGAKRSQLRMIAISESCESEKFLVLAGRRLVAGRASIMEPMLHLEQILEKNPEAAP